MFDFMKESIGDELKGIKFTSSLGKHPVSLSSEGELSVNMEKTLSKMPGNEAGGFKAQLVLEINMNHAIAERLKTLYNSDKEKLGKYSKILFAQAKLISGMQIENPTELTDMVCDLILE